MLQTSKWLDTLGVVVEIVRGLEMLLVQSSLLLLKKEHDEQHVREGFLLL